MEAMSFGKPIITTDVPGCNNLVVDQYNGYLVKPKNQSDLAETILKFIKLKYEDKNRMGILSRKIIEESFRVEFVIERTAPTQCCLMNSVMRACAKNGGLRHCSRILSFNEF